MDIPWYGVIPIVGIVVWGVIVIVAVVGRSKKSGAAAAVMQQNIDTNQAVLAKLESIEARLGAVEKTLTDIP